MNLNPINLALRQRARSSPQPFPNILWKGKAGFYGDPSSASDLFLTSAGEVNVSAPGDPIGLFERQAGSFNWSQPTSAARPVWARFPRGGIRNLLSNNMFADATDGSLPPGWTNSGAGVGTLTRTITYHARPDGTPFMRVRYVGTTSTTSTGITLGPITSVPTPTGVDFTLSTTCGVAAGSLTNISSLNISSRRYDSGGSFIGTSAATSLPLSVQPLTNTVTAPAGSVYMIPGISLTFSSGVDIDVTIEVEPSQYERGSVATPLQQVYSPTDITEPGQPSVYLPYYDGSQWMDSGVESFGNASLFADAGQEWTTITLARSLNPGGGGQSALAATNSSTGALRKFQLVPTGSGTPTCFLRGNQEVFAGAPSMYDGGLHLIIVRWNGSVAQGFYRGSTYNLNVGTAVDETANITSGCRLSAGSPTGFWNGHLHNMVIDRALTNSEIDQVRTWAANTYGVQM